MRGSSKKSGCREMKILHLFSDWKWTGPAEPVLDLCKALEKRGHDVTLAYRKPPFPAEDSLEKRVLGESIKATNRFHLNHSLKFNQPFSLWDNLRDLRSLTHYLRQEKFDILNVHHSHDHILGGISARLAKCPTVIIRSDHKRDPLKSSLGNRLLVSHFSDGLITFSERARREDAAHFGFPMERVARIIPALNLERIDSRKQFRDMRTVFRIMQEDVIIGMIARFQKYRRTKVFLEAVRMIARQFPNFKVLLVGRSSQMEESVIQPMKRLGVEPWVILGGYRTDDYFDTLACMDIFVFLMGGSDGTARALREAMAMGKPVIVANRGMLPELVDHGVSGLVVDDSPELLAEATLQLLRNPEGRRAMGKAAWEKAHREFRLDRQVEAVEKFYQEMISLGKWKRK
jgi:glycosyltransferase involved in cell wall biosynthesis